MAQASGILDGHSATPIAQQSLPSRLVTIVRALGASPDRRAIMLLVGGIVVVICATAAAQVRLNAWNQPFYDSLAQKHASAFLAQLVVFAVLACILLGLNVAQAWLDQTLKMRLRAGLTRDLLGEWLKPARAFRLAGVGEIGANPDQRIAADAQHLTDLSGALGIGLLQATLLLLSFVGVLWILSEGMVFTVRGTSFVVPGYMVWCALFYAATASWISWRVGRPLIALNAERYAREADLRSALVRVSEHIDGITVYGGEPDERRRLEIELDRVLAVMAQLIRATVRLTWVTGGYGWFALVAPILVAAPAYFGGDLTFGELMMAVGAFMQVQQALRWFVDNFGAIADWQATFLRVMTFREALLSEPRPEDAASRIEIAEDPSGNLTLHNLGIRSAAGLAVLDEPEVEIAPGERVLIVGQPGCGKSMLFRTLAGLWSEGTGRIGLPPRAHTMFLPQRPYIPPTTLRGALSYPAEPGKFSDAELVAALERTGMGHLATDLDRLQRWDVELTIGEQQRLAFARLLLEKPQWVFMDEAVDTLDDGHRKLILSIFERELAGTGVVSIGRRDVPKGFYTRTLHLALAGDEPAPRAVAVPRLA